MNKKAFIAVCLLIAALVGGGIWFSGMSRRSQARDAAQLQQMRAALAETENLNPEKAAALWQQVLDVRPGDPDILQNLAVSRVSRLITMTARLEDRSLDEEQRQTIVRQLPAAIIEAREAVDALQDAAETSGQTRRSIVAAWLRTEVEAAEANQLSEAEKRAALRRTVERLAAQLAASPQALILSGPLDLYAQHVQDPIEGLPEDLADTLADAFLAASETHPRNLFVALKALEYAILAQDKRAAAVARKSGELAEPIGEMIREDAAKLGKTPQQLAGAIAEQVEAAQWRRAEALRMPWYNILNSTEALRTDRRRANPNVLDLVVTESVNELSAKLAAQSPPPRASGPLALAISEPLTEGLHGSDAARSARAVCTVDFDLRGTPEIAVAGGERLQILALGDGDRWRPVAESPIPAGVRGLTVADLFIVDGSSPQRIKIQGGEAAGLDAEALARQSRGHNTFPSLMVWGSEGISIVRIDGRSGTAADDVLLPPANPTGLEAIRDVTAVAPGDIDADGDLDLIIATRATGVGVWINRGNMSFFPLAAHSQLPPANEAVVDMAIGDFDRDLDLDILTVAESGIVGWLENLLHLQLRWSPIDGLTPLEAGRGVAMVEWDGNVSWDVVFSGAQTLGVATTSTLDAGVIRVVDSETVASGGRLIVGDFNNDSWPDLFTYDEAGGRIVAGGPGELESSAPLPLTELEIDDAAAADFDGDGRIDLVFVSEGVTRLMMNRTKDVGHYLDVRMTGIDDNATGRVNHYAIGSVLELRFGPHYRAQVITDRTTHFGIDGYRGADTLRAILTNGITQNVIDPPIDTTLVEIQTLKGSCPYIYAWDGEKYAFVTDCLWAAPLGLQQARGKVVPDRPWEYLKLDGKFLAPLDGAYELRLTEELWELAYFDRVSLIAVDHPADVEIWTNEKVGPPEVVDPKVFAFAETRPIAGAVDARGADVTQLLSTADEKYVQGFDRRLLQGLCPPHWIDLDLGALDSDDRVLLVLTGWILPTDTSLNIQIDQNPHLNQVEPPSVWVPGAAGQWEQVIPAMGFPGGKTKTIVVELTGRFKASDPRVRIRTSAQIYWDEVKVAVNPPAVEIVSQPLQLESAEVCFHGFSGQLPRTPTQPHRYDYARVLTQPKWPPLRGALTRYGDCLSLLRRWDDSMVVIGAGDEIRLRFRFPGDPVQEGWERDFILHSVGWDKDADLNTLAGQSVEPLPFRQMQAYPPPAAQSAQAAKVEAKNAWHRNRYQSFRAFWTPSPGHERYPFQSR